MAATERNGPSRGLLRNEDTSETTRDDRRPAGDRGAERANDVSRSSGALLAAALALPGMLPAAVNAQSVHDRGWIELKYLDYRDWQSGANRMGVRSPSFYTLVPVSDTVEIEGSVVYDAMSGASPLYFNTLSGASGQGVGDYRTAGEAKITKYFSGWAIGVSGVASSEQDYLSRGGAVDLRIFSDDRNRTYAFGVAGASDRVNPINGLVANAPRNTVEFLLGITQALSATSIVNSNVTYSYGHGYFDDPYKVLDKRPADRTIVAWLTRYNQYFAEPDGTLRLSYRLLHDSFGSTSNTLGATWVQALPAGWSLAPRLRYYTQSAASFFYGPPAGSGRVAGQPFTMDTRLSAFGAVTVGVGVAKALPDGWSVDLRADYYRQESNWRLVGSGSTGMLPFSARWLLAGISKAF